MSNKLVIVNSGNVPQKYSKDIYIDISTISKIKMQDIHGTSLLENRKIDKLVNIKSIFNSLHNIFTWVPGQRILDPEFGSILYSLLYNGINSFTTEQIVAEIKTAIMRWEPRVKVIGVINSSNIMNTENNLIQLDVLFTVPSLNDNQQYIYTYTQNKTLE